jgi:hypothetical protein
VKGKTVGPTWVFIERFAVQALLVVLATSVGAPLANASVNRYIWCSTKSKKGMVEQKFFSSAVFSGSWSVTELDTAFGKYVRDNYPADGASAGICTTYPSQKAAEHFRDLEEAEKGKREQVTVVSTGWKYDPSKPLYCHQTGPIAPCSTGIEGCGFDGDDLWLTFLPDGSAKKRDWGTAAADAEVIPLKRQPDGTVKVFEAGYTGGDASTKIEWRRIMTLKLSRSGASTGFWQYGPAWIQQEQERHQLKGDLSAKYGLSCHSTGDPRFIFCQGDYRPGGVVGSQRVYSAVFQGRGDAIDQYLNQWVAWMRGRYSTFQEDGVCWDNYYSREDADYFKHKQEAAGNNEDVPWVPK